jgi:hypothetical protein
VVLGTARASAATGGPLFPHYENIRREPMRREHGVRLLALAGILALLTGCGDIMGPGPAEAPEPVDYTTRNNTTTSSPPERGITPVGG